MMLVLLNVYYGFNVYMFYANFLKKIVIYIFIGVIILPDIDIIWLSYDVDIWEYYNTMY